MIAFTNHTMDFDFSHRSCGCAAAKSVWIPAVRQGRRVVCFLLSNMGQYFKAVNTDKKEYVCPWCLGGGAKLWEWAANSHGAIFTLLLRKSDKCGGGDVGRKTVVLQLEDSPSSLAEAVMAGVAAEGTPFGVDNESIIGRWAGDRVVLVGDYDSSGLWDDLQEYRNISAQVAEEWNRFIELPEMQLERNGSCSCSQVED
jgi:hypothetical protein